MNSLHHVSCRVDRNGLEVLERTASLALLATARLARLGYVSEGGQPVIIPLNVVLEGDAVLFRLSTGGALAAITARKHIVLEIDALDPDGCGGWSVSIRGVAIEVPAQLAAWSGTPCMSSVLRGSSGRLFRVETADIDGRRLLPAAGVSP